MQKIKILLKRTMLTLVIFTGLMLLPTKTVKADTTWTTWYESFEGGTIRVIVPSSLSSIESRVCWLVEMADRSTVTAQPISLDYDGLISPGDVIVITPSQMLWFDTTWSGTITTNGGGGMLRGYWPLGYDGSGSLNFTNIINPNNYAPNYFYAGSRPQVQGSGISFLANYENDDNGYTLSVENCRSTTVTSVTGVTCFNGKYNGDGVFVQFTGLLTNSSTSSTYMGSGVVLSSITDTDRGYGVSETAYTLTYRIPSSGQEFRQEITVDTPSGSGYLGKLATFVLSNNISPQTEYSSSSTDYSHNFRFVVNSVSPLYYPLAESNNLYPGGTSTTLKGQAALYYDIAPTHSAETKRGVAYCMGVYPKNSGAKKIVIDPTQYIASVFSSYYRYTIETKVGDEGASSYIPLSAMDVQYFDKNHGDGYKTFSSSFTLIADYSLEY